MTDPFNLLRFQMAQEAVHPSTLLTNYEQAEHEIQQGRKRSHWIWFILPVPDGVSDSVNGRYYAIHSKAEAEAYLASPVLRKRWYTIVKETFKHLDEGIPLEYIYGDVDAHKFRCSLRLFDRHLLTFV